MPHGVRVRFAPSPTGHLHVGNARTALFNWLFARGKGGTFILRIEDTDVERSTTVSEEAIFEDLRWLGLDWDEGPMKGGPRGPYRQSERTEAYAGAARRLLEQGAAYYCFCTVEELESEREEQRQRGLPPAYGGRCRILDPDESARRAAKEPHTLRFRASVERVGFDDLIRGHVEFPGAQIGDPVIVRQDGTPTYNFAVVVDDSDMRISHVIRGEDHLSNTPRQVLIYRALGLEPPLFAHVSMVLGPDGSPLSKRHGASSVSDFRHNGILPEAMLNYLVLLGWAHPEGREVLTAAEIIAAFDIGRVGHAAAMFDLRKLGWLNAHYLRTMPADQLLAAGRASLAEAGYVGTDPGDADLEIWIATALQTFSGQMETLTDAARATRPLFRFEEHLEADPTAREAFGGLAAEPAAVSVIERFAEAIEQREPPLLSDCDAFREVARQVGREAGVKGRGLYHPIRVALTGEEKGPELDRLVPLIEEGSRLPLPGPVLSCAKRARLAAARLKTAS